MERLKNAHPIMCEDSPSDKNAAPERCMQRKNPPTDDELYWKSEYKRMAELCRQMEISSERIEFKLEDEIKHLKAQLAAAMSPVPSESDEATETVCGGE